MIKPLTKIIATVVVTAICCTACVSANADDKTSADTADPVRSSAVVTTTTPTTSKPKKASFKKFNCYVKKTSAKVHKKANKNSKVVKTAYKGKKFKVTAIKGNWYKVGKNQWVHKNHLSKKNPMKKFKGVRLKYMGTYNVTSNRLTRRKGVVRYNGHRETFYSQKVLPGHGLKIPGRHVASDGTIRDKDGYICISANPGWKNRGSVLMTSLGPGKVYDSGVPRGTIDIYCNW